MVLCQRYDTVIDCFIVDLPVTAIAKSLRMASANMERGRCDEFIVIVADI
jgi:hypothetical protein